MNGRSREDHQPQGAVRELTSEQWQLYKYATMAMTEPEKGEKLGAYGHKKSPEH